MLFFETRLFRTTLCGTTGRPHPRYGTVRYGTVQCGPVRCGAVRCSAVRSGAVRYGTVRCGAVRCGSLQCGAVRCGAVRCGSLQCDSLQLRVGVLKVLFATRSPRAQLETKTLKNIASNTAVYRRFLLSFLPPRRQSRWTSPSPASSGRAETWAGCGGSPSFGFSTP